MKKRIGAALMALLLFFTAANPAWAVSETEDFLDVDSNAWYAQAVRYCRVHVLMQGSGRNARYFEPDKEMTRAQMAVTLWRMSGEPVTALSMQYRDVPEGCWYADAVRWTVTEGILPGLSPTVFAPDEPIRREDLAYALWSYARFINGFVPELDSRTFEQYRDYDKVSDYARDAMCWASCLGLINGVRDTDGTEVLVPWAHASRAATATILMRFCLDMAIYG